MTTIDRTATALPHLTVVLCPHTHGYDWVIDVDSCTVWVSGAVSPDHWSAALRDALAELRRAHRIPDIPAQRTPLRLAYSDSA